MESKVVELSEIEGGRVVARDCGERKNGKMLSRGTNFQLCRLSSGDLIYSNVITVNNTVLYTWNLLKE